MSSLLEHEFTKKILEILEKNYPQKGEEILSKNPLMQYLNIKTRAAISDSKSRASFGNFYAIYVLIEDYLKNDFDSKGKYSDYEGAQFSTLLRRMRELPFGQKLQNHALNHRLNEEFARLVGNSGSTPIVRDPTGTSRYWINENLLRVNISGKEISIAQSIKEIIDAYIDARKNSFDAFISNCEQILKMEGEKSEESANFILRLLSPNVDARIFEIVSYAILKYYYSDLKIYWGWQPDAVKEDYLKLYKTGRTNANDGGIDFVMKPLGRFFQVTEVLDVGKYFLDIEKIERYPITFVVKTERSKEEIFSEIEKHAYKRYPVKLVVEKLMGAIEDVINIGILMEFFDEVIRRGGCNSVMEEIIHQSKVEFQLDDNDEES